MSAAQSTTLNPNALPSIATPEVQGSLYNAFDFMIRQVVAGKAFAGMVQVKAVSGGGTTGTPTVSVQPMVSQMDGNGNLRPHGTIANVPAFRLQGGSGAAILDPAVGDIGLAIICDRDISTVKATGAVSGPGSWRQNDWADGVYFGGLINGNPTRYVRLSSSGTSIVDTQQISLTVGGFGIAITSSGTTIDGKPFLTHQHTLVQTGTSDSGPVL